MAIDQENNNEAEAREEHRRHAKQALLQGLRAFKNRIGQVANPDVLRTMAERLEGQRAIIEKEYGARELVEGQSNSDVDALEVWMEYDEARKALEEWTELIADLPKSDATPSPETKGVSGGSNGAPEPQEKKETGPISSDVREKIGEAEFVGVSAAEIAAAKGDAEILQGLIDQQIKYNQEHPVVPPATEIEDSSEAEDVPEDAERGRKRGKVNRQRLRRKKEQDLAEQAEVPLPPPRESVSRRSGPPRAQETPREPRLNVRELWQNLEAAVKTAEKGLSDEELRTGELRVGFFRMVQEMEGVLRTQNDRAVGNSQMQDAVTEKARNLERLRERFTKAVNTPREAPTATPAETPRPVPAEASPVEKVAPASEPEKVSAPPVPESVVVAGETAPVEPPKAQKQPNGNDNGRKVEIKVLKTYSAEGKGGNVAAAVDAIRKLKVPKEDRRAQPVGRRTPRTAEKPAGERQDKAPGLSNEEVKDMWRQVERAAKRGVPAPDDPVRQSLRKLQEKYGAPEVPEKFAQMFRDNTYRLAQIEESWAAPSAEAKAPARARPRVAEPSPGVVRGEIPPPPRPTESATITPAVEPAAGGSPSPEQIAEERLRKRTFKYLDQQYMRGVQPDQMLMIFRQGKKPDFLPQDVSLQDFARAAELYAADVAAGYDPLARLAAEISIKFIKNYEELNADTKAAAEQKFVESARDLWSDFVYSAKLVKTKEHGEIWVEDADVKVTKWLLRRAGVTGIEDAKPVLPGTLAKGKFNIDTGGEMGVAVMKDRTPEPEGPVVTVVGDNHPKGRQYVMLERAPHSFVYGSSTAEFFHALLERAGLMRYEGSTDAARARDRRVIEMMLKYTIDDDNASFPASTRGRLVDYKNSDHTVMGLGSKMDAEELYKYFAAGADLKKSMAQNYRDGVLRELSEKEVRDNGLDEERKKIRRGIKQAEKIFEREGGRRDDRELIEEGRLVETRDGKIYVDVVLGPGDKLRGGHKAVQGYGQDESDPEHRYAGYLCYDLSQQSFMLNTLESDSDLSRNPKLRDLAGRQGQFVRGTMFIKSPDGSPLQITFAELLDALGAHEPRGRAKEILEREASGEFLAPRPVATPAAVETEGAPGGVFAGETPAAVAEEDAEKAPAAEVVLEEFSGSDLEVLRHIAQDNLTKFKEILLLEYQGSEDMLRDSLGDRFYSLISGDVEEYIKLVQKQAPMGGEEGIRESVIQRYVPYVRAWILENYEMTREELQEFFGQAYNDLGLDRAPEVPQEKNIPLIDVRDIIAKSFSERGRLARFELTEENGDLRVRSTLDAGDAAGMIEIDLTISPSGEGLVVKNLDLAANSIAEDFMRKYLSELPDEIKAALEAQEGVKIAGIRAQKGELVITLK